MAKSLGYFLINFLCDSRFFEVRKVNNDTCGFFINISLQNSRKKSTKKREIEFSTFS